MAIPLATTTITVERVVPDPDRDPMDPQPEPTVIATGVRAHISTSTGSEAVGSGAEQSVTNFRMSCDPFDGGLHHEATVTDDLSGEVYEVVWSVSRVGLDLDHFQAGLTQVSGLVSSGGGR